MEKINILACTIFNYPHIGGSSSHLSALKEELEKDEFVNFEILSWNSENYIYSLLKKYQISVLHRILNRDLRYVTNKGIFYLSQKIKYKLNKTRYNILNPQSIFSMNSILLINESFFVPKILTIHGYATYEAESAGLIRTERERDFYMQLEYRAYKNADLILTVDSNIKEYIAAIDKGFRDKTVVWPNSVKNIFFISQTMRSQFKVQTRERLGINEDAFVILCPRRLVPKNGVLIPLKSLISLPRVENIFLIYAGDGMLRKNIEKMIPDWLKKRIIILGNIDHNEMPRIYSIADVVVIPSVLDKGVEEATSISALEAAAVGIPIIASDIGGLKEVFKSYDNAILVEPNNVQALANAIIEIKNDSNLRSSLILKARKLVEEKYLPSIWASNYIRYAKGVMEKINATKKKLLK